MSSLRSIRPAAKRLCLPVVLLMLSLASTASHGQTQAPASVPASIPAPTPAPQPAAVAPPTKAPANSFPAVPAYTKTPPPPPQQPDNQDPLLAPVTVPPGPAAPPAQVAPPQPVSPSMLPSIAGYDLSSDHPRIDALGSTYIPVDSTIYPMALRLYSLGYLNTAFINMRPWTRRSLLHMLQASTPDIMDSHDDQAIGILTKLNEYLAAEIVPTPSAGFSASRGSIYGLDTVYTRLLGVSGQTLRDGYHLGQTLNNDYGRPYQSGFNDITGFSTVNEYGRFSLYVRGEYQHSPSGVGYNTSLAYTLSTIDQITYSPSLNQATIPNPIIAAQNPFRLQEATLSFHLWGHEISGGKSDAWQGPGLGGAMSWSNNAEDIYSFRINRTEPVHIPYLSRVLGPLRYDFFVGSLKGHTDPNSPWVHSAMFSFAPTSNFQFAFERTVIWGGEGHTPITLHTFLKSFFSISDTSFNEKYSRDDPGARYSDFSFSWRLPFLTHSVTLYADTIAHDDVSPVSAPRRAAYRPGIYLSQFPHLHKLDLRVEGVSTDYSTLASQGGQGNYYETVQHQGYTNKGFLMGDWIGREAKGGQAWATYHLSPNEWVQFEYLNKKTPKDFIPGGTTQNQFKADVVKRFLHDQVELDAWLQVERWKAPIYMTGQQSDTTVAAQITFFPKLRTTTKLNGK